MTLESDFLHLRIGYFDAGRIIFVDQTCFDFQARFRSSSGNELQYGFVIKQRLCSPVHADERKHTVFNRLCAVRDYAQSYGNLRDLVTLTRDLLRIISSPVVTCALQLA